MSGFPWTTNVKRNDEASSIYWRISKRLELDPIASMLTKDTRDGLAMAVYDGIVDDDHKAKFSRSGLRPYIKGTIQRSPLSILSDQAIDHLTNVVYSGLIVNEEE